MDGSFNKTSFNITRCILKVNFLHIRQANIHKETAERPFRCPAGHSWMLCYCPTSSTLCYTHLYPDFDFAEPLFYIAFPKAKNHNPRIKRIKNRSGQGTLERGLNFGLKLCHIRMEGIPCNYAYYCIKERLLLQ